MLLGFIKFFIRAGVLTGLLYWLARDEADFEFSKVLLVVSLIGLAAFVMDMIFLMSMLGLVTDSSPLVEISPFMGLLIRMGLRVGIGFGFVLFVVVKFCWVPLKKAVLVTILFFIFSGLLIFGAQFVYGKLTGTQAINFQMPAMNASGNMENPDLLVQGMWDGMTEEDWRRMEEEAKVRGMTLEELKTERERAMSALLNGDVPSPPSVLPPEGVPQSPPPALPVKPPPVKEKKRKKQPAPLPNEPGIKVYKLTCPEQTGTGHWKGLRGSKKMLHISAIFADGHTRYAVVNGSMVEEGSIVEVEYKGEIHRWKVGEVRREGVIWESLKSKKNKP